ncbi:MAG TPA: hypothetical protein ENH85_09755 [Candidatus Scalindua sp.]|nr:hypothetical protein [Candidatus Scalindua sp.]
MDKVMVLLKEIPMLKKGKLFYFETETGHVWGMKNKHTTNSYPLRNGLANYLWLLRTEKGYFRKINLQPKRG